MRMVAISGLKSRLESLGKLYSADFMGFPGKKTFNLERERGVLSTLSYDIINP